MSYLLFVLLMTAVVSWLGYRYLEKKSWTPSAGIDWLIEAPLKLIEWLVDKISRGSAGMPA